MPNEDKLRFDAPHFSLKYKTYPAMTSVKNSRSKYKTCPAMTSVKIIDQLELHNSRVWKFFIESTVKSLT